MKTTWKFQISTFLVALFFITSLNANTSNLSTDPELPGDHFSLEGALSLFKEAKSLEAFEKSLNSEDNYVNNLDLNDDGKTDYVRVLDNMDGDVHAIILQVPINENESQDIAVIEIEKTGANNAVLQIVGDEDVYGEQTIVEPFEEEGSNDGKGGPSVEMGTNRLIVNVWFWSPVRFIYAPGYRVWTSPWRWAHYPRWWNPWRPRPLHVCHARRVVYRPHFHRVKTHRVVRAHKVYTPKRRTTKVVRTKTTTHVAVKGKNGKKVVGSKTTTSVTAKGKNGNKVGASKTTTKVRGTGKNGGKVAGSRTTTKAGAKNKNGAVGKKRTTTTTAKKGKKGAVSGKKRTTVTRKRKKG